MGQAKIRRDAAHKASQAVAAVNREHFAQAVRQIVGAISHVDGADCLTYALVGAGLLRELGVPARAVAGTAAWRVGPGDGDVVSHDPSADTAVVVGVGRAAMFHAWTEYDSPQGPIVVDLTTRQLRDKAASLDEADGGHTQVDFCPDLIWQPAPAERSARWVAQQYDPGIFTYVRNPKIEEVVLGENRHEIDHETQQAIAGAVHVYRALAAGTVIRVIGVDENGDHQETAPSLDSVAKIRIR